MDDMKKHVRTTIRYDGPALSSHEMDVQDLAPALLALADIVQIANKKFNQDQAEIRVLVNADVHQKCFMIDVSLVQSLLDQAKLLFGVDEIKTAKEIAEWIGIIGGGSVGLFQLLKFMRGKGDDGTKLEIKQETGSTTVTITGNGNEVTVPLQTYQLAQEKDVVDRAKAVMKPLEKEGYESLSFLEGGTEIFEVSDQEATEIVATPIDDLEPLPNEASSTIRGGVRIKSAQYEGAAQWSFLWDGRAINAEMADKAAEWVIDFQENKIDAPPNTILDVTMIQTVRLDDEGMAIGKASYRVTEVHSAKPPPKQMGIFDNDDT